MEVLPIVLILVMVGFGMFVVNRFIPIEKNILMIINVFVVIAVIVWLFQASGVHTGAPKVKI